MAAVIACGAGAALSHRSAAELWELLGPWIGPVEVTVPSVSGRKPRAGIRVHRSPSLNASTTAHRGIPVTTPARTLADLARTAPAWVHRKAVRQAEFIGLPTGIATDRTRSELERAFLRLCRRHRVPPPEVNARVGRFTVDFLWPEQRLVVEADGYAAHRGRQAFRDDRARELELGTIGLRLRRFSDHQIDTQPAAVAAAVRTELERGGAFQSPSA